MKIEIDVCYYSKWGFKYQVTKSYFPLIVMFALKTVSYYTLLNSEKSFLTLNCVTEHPEKISAIKAKWKILPSGHTA